jgi:hypothetical protein
VAREPERAWEQCERVSLAEAAQTLLDECRMVLPGIQAILGFQLIAVFNERFAHDLDGFDQRLHMAAVSLVAVAVGLVMTPAAYHRSRGARNITDTFIHVSSMLLLASMVPLALGLSLDFHLIAKLVFGDEGVARWFGAALGTLLLSLWFVFPHLHRLHAAMANVRERYVER